METQTINGVEYEVTRKTAPEYRSHINGWVCTNPDNWWATYLRDPKTDKHYIAWYFDDGNSEDPCDPDIDWDNPDDMEEANWM